MQPGLQQRRAEGQVRKGDVLRSVYSWPFKEEPTRRPLALCPLVLTSSMMLSQAPLAASSPSAAPRGEGNQYGSGVHVAGSPSAGRTWTGAQHMGTTMGPTGSFGGSGMQEVEERAPLPSFPVCLAYPELCSSPAWQDGASVGRMSGLIQQGQDGLGGQVRKAEALGLA
jgi:hypothetical protein